MSGTGIAGSGVREEWSAGWRVVVAGGVGLGVISMHFYSLGVFVQPLGEEFGWTRAQVAAGPGITSLVILLLSAQVGRLVDAVGVRRVAIPGYIAYCLAFAALGSAGPSIWSWYAGYALLGCCQLFAFASIWTLAIASRFDRSRGLALAVALCGMGLMAAAAPVVSSLGLIHFGWRATYRLLGLVALAGGLPILIAWMHSAHDLARLRRSPGGISAVTPGFSFGEALRMSQFWMIAAASLFIATGIGGLILHFVPMAVDAGIDRATAAAVAGVIGIASLAGRLLSGVMMDRLPGRLVGGAMFMLPVFSCLLLAVAGNSVPLTIAAAVILGFATGAEFDVLAVLVSRYFGMRGYAAIYGQIAALFAIGMGLGPVVGGILFDTLKSYGTLLWIFIGIFLVGSVLILLLGRAPRWEGLTLKASDETRRNL